MDERFKKVEEEYFRHKRELAAGRITPEQFDPAPQRNDDARRTLPMRTRYGSYAVVVRR